MSKKLLRVAGGYNVSLTTNVPSVVRLAFRNKFNKVGKVKQVVFNLYSFASSVDGVRTAVFLVNKADLVVTTTASADFFETFILKPDVIATVSLHQRLDTAVGRNITVRTVVIPIPEPGIMVKGDLSIVLISNGAPGVVGGVEVYYEEIGDNNVKRQLGQ